MNTGIISKAISNIVEAQSEKKSEGFTMVNVRPGEKVSAMLDVLAHLSQKSPSEVIADALSRKIAAHAASSQMYADAILDAAEQVVLEHGVLYKESALGILEEQGLLKIRSPYTRNFDLSVFYKDIDSLAWVKLALPDTVKLNPHAYDASIYVYDDDKDVFVSFSCHDPEIVNIAESAFASICPLHERQLVERELIWTPRNNPSSSELERATIVARESLIAAGFVVVAQRFSGGLANA